MSSMVLFATPRSSHQSWKCERMMASAPSQLSALAHRGSCSATSINALPTASFAQPSHTTCRGRTSSQCTSQHRWSLPTACLMSSNSLTMWCVCQVGVKCKVTWITLPIVEVRQLKRARALQDADDAARGRGRGVGRGHARAGRGHGLRRKPLKKKRCPRFLAAFIIRFYP